MEGLGIVIFFFQCRSFCTLVLVPVFVPQSSPIPGQQARVAAPDRSSTIPRLDAACSCGWLLGPRGRATNAGNYQQQSLALTMKNQVTPFSKLFTLRSCSWHDLPSSTDELIEPGIEAFRTSMNDKSANSATLSPKSSAGAKLLVA